jgi:spore germination protein KB
MNYVYTSLLRYTPLYLSIGFTVAFVLYMILKGGITAIGRFGEVVGPVFILMMFIPMLMMPHGLNWEQLLPVYVDSGWKSILQGVIPCVAIFSEYAMSLLMLTQFMANPQNARWVPMWAVGIMAVWASLAAVVCIVFVGVHVAPRCTYPWVTYIRSINILDFIQNIDAFSAFIWTFANTISIATSLFMTSYGIAELWNPSHWRTVAVIVSVVAFVCAVLSLPMPHFTTVIRQTIFVPWVLPVNMIGIPLLFYIVGSWRRRVVL